MRVGDGAAAELRDLAERVARAARSELLDRTGRHALVETKSSPTDPVSDADRAAERVLVATLSAARPGDGLLGEEGARRASRTGITWVIDSLDGTVNYLYGLPDWCVSVAAEDAAGALVAVVHHPVLDETYAAIRGAGATLDDVPIRVNDPVPARLALVATGFSYTAERRRRQAETVRRLLQEIRDVRRAGSCALDLCWVAAGRVDGYLEEDVKHWDWAAGALVASEAGAVVSGLAVDPAYAGIVAAGPALFPELLAVAGHTGGDRPLVTHSSG